MADLAECCETASVASYESFWLATAAAAPVIALAAVVALPDTADIYQAVQRASDERYGASAEFRAALQVFGTTGATAVEAVSEIDRATRRLRVWAAFLRWTAIGNVMVQAVLLALSLVALAYNVHVIPRWLAIVLPAGSIVLLGATVSLTSEYRWLAKAFPEILEEAFTKQRGKMLPTTSETAQGTAEKQVSPGDHDT